MGVFGMAGSHCGRALVLREGTRCTSPAMPTAESLFDERECCEFSLDMEEVRAAARMSGCGTTCDVTELRERCADIQRAWAKVRGGAQRGSGDAGIEDRWRPEDHK